MVEQNKQITKTVEISVPNNKKSDISDDELCVMGQTNEYDDEMQYQNKKHSTKQRAHKEFTLEQKMRFFHSISIGKQVLQHFHSNPLLNNKGRSVFKHDYTDSEYDELRQSNSYQNVQIVQHSTIHDSSQCDQKNLLQLSKLDNETDPQNFELKNSLQNDFEYPCAMSDKKNQEKYNPEKFQDLCDDYQIQQMEKSISDKSLESNKASLGSSNDLKRHFSGDSKFSGADLSKGSSFFQSEHVLSIKSNSSCDKSPASISFGDCQSKQNQFVAFTERDHEMQKNKLLKTEDCINIFKNSDYFSLGNSVIFSNLKYYGQIIDFQMSQRQVMYSKTSKKKNTLIFEPINTFFEIIDLTKKQKKTIRDATVKTLQIKDKDTNQWQNLMIRINRESVFSRLKELKKKNELIMFSYLPKAFLDEFKRQLPELHSIFDHTIGREDCQIFEDLLIRDISILFDGIRQPNKIKVVDNQENNCDLECLNVVSMKSFDQIKKCKVIDTT